MMRRLCASVCLVFFVLMLIAYNMQSITPETLPPKHQKWLNEEVVYIITPIEKDVFLQLATDREREMFIEAFWKHRDPTPGTPENEFKTQHYERIRYADYNFGRSAPKQGWQTERGRIYILLGKPNDIEKYISEPGIYNTEVWFYHGMAEYGLPSEFYLVFFQEDGVGEYVLYMPGSDGPQSLLSGYIGDPTDHMTAYKDLKKINPRLARISLSLIPGEPTGFGRPSLASDILIQNINTVPQKQYKDTYAKKFLLYKDVVEVDYSANYMDSDSLVRILKDESGFSFVHYIIELKRFSLLQFQEKFVTTLIINGTVTDPGGKTIFQYEGSIPLEFRQEQVANIMYRPFDVYDMFPLLPGVYQLSVLLKNETSKEFATLEKDIIVPDDDGTLRLSDLILGYKTDQTQSENLKPFKIGTELIFAQPHHTFHPQDTLFVCFQILGTDPEWEKKGHIRYVLYRMQEELFTFTRNIDDYPDRLSIKEEFALAEIPPGHYRLEVHLSDGEKDYFSRSEPFDITSASGFPRPWVYSKTMFPLSHPAFASVIGQQYFNKGDLDRARVHYEQAYNSAPNSMDYALNLSRLYLLLGEFEKIKNTLLPLERSSDPNYEMYYLLGKSHQELSQWSHAISFFDKAISHFGASTVLLNALGECHFRLGETKRALSYWNKSLEILPDQPDIKSKIESIRRPD